MNENKAQERIHRAVLDSLSWLDELPSRETEILEQTKKEAEPLITIYNGTSETRIEPAYTPAVNRNPSVRFRSLAAIAAVLVLLAGLWTVRLNRSDNPPLDTVTQPLDGETTPGQESITPQLPAAINLQDGTQSLDRIDLYVEEDLLWNEETGILTEGDNVDKSKGIPFQNTVYRQVARNGGSAEGKLEYRNGQGTLLFTDEISLQLDTEDSYSMDMPQKSFLLKASDGSFDYPLFDDRTSDAYPTILLRNGGNDSMWTRVMDEVQHRLIERHTEARLLTQAWKPVNVYLNGEYWGIYNMRENVDAYTVCRYEQIPDDQADNVAILYIGGSYVQATKEQRNTFIRTRKKIKNSDPAHNPEDLAYLEQEIDIDSFLDWFTVEMYFGNSDIGNGMVYRVPGGKWKCLIQDLDYGLFNSSFNSVKSFLKEKGMGERAIDNSIFLKILEVDKYRELFFTKLGSLFHSLTTDVMLAELDECVEWIEPSMQAHFDRWGSLYDKAILAEVPTTPEGARKYWESRIKRLRNTMKKRPTLLYNYIQDYFGMSDAEMHVYFPADLPADLSDTI